VGQDQRYLVRRKWPRRLTQKGTQQHLKQRPTPLRLSQNTLKKPQQYVTSANKTHVPGAPQVAEAAHSKRYSAALQAAADTAAPFTKHTQRATAIRHKCEQDPCTWCAASGRGGSIKKVLSSTSSSGRQRCSCCPRNRARSLVNGQPLTARGKPAA
jgi:hypothetical protein